MRCDVRGRMRLPWLLLLLLVAGCQRGSSAQPAKDAGAGSTVRPLGKPAAPPSPAIAEIPEAAAGQAGALMFRSGGPLVAERWGATLERSDADVRIAETVELAVPHGAATLMVPDLRDPYADEQGPGKLDAWGLREVTVRIDGRPASLRHQQFEEDILDFQGGYAFEVPESARKIEVRSRIATSAPSDHSTGWGWDGRTSSGWGAPPRRFELKMTGLGDWPATHLAVGTAGAEPAGGLGSRWSYSAGVLTLALERERPPLIGVEVPARPCDFPVCEDDDDAATCVEATDFFHCAGVLSDPDKLERWLKEARQGCYGPPDGTAALRLARNWIHARHGYRFATPELRAWAQKQPWYTPRVRNVEALLDAREKKALEGILELERQAAVHCR